MTVERYAADVNALKGDLYNVISGLGEDPDREGLRETPMRAAKALMEMTRGYTDNPKSWWRSFSAEAADQMICQFNIPVYSLCEHHLLPFIGVAHIGYICKEKICGLSKLGRVVDMYSRRLQVQERLTHEIMGFLDNELKPRGVMVVVEAEHLCMTLRGVQISGTKTVTSAVTGDFLHPEEGSRDEFLKLLAATR